MSMNRELFLDAQLWLRRTPTAYWEDAIAVDANAARDDEGVDAEPHTQAARTPPLMLLLPPPAAGANTAYGCFHVGSRFCFFTTDDTDKDPTQFELELRMRQDGNTNSCELLARFDAKHVYAVDLQQVHRVVPPTPAPETTTAAAPVQSALPFGCLEFQNVSLRIWMDPHSISSAAARPMLQQALRAIHDHATALVAREPCVSRVVTVTSSWRDAYRHSRPHFASSTASSAGAATQAHVTSNELLTQARRLFPRDADYEVAKMAIATVVQASHQATASRRRKRRSVIADTGDLHEDGSDSSVVTNDSALLSTQELALLLTELTHMFGDAHDGVSELLGFSVPSTSSVTSVVSKWDAWDAYLDAAADATRPVSDVASCKDGDDDDLKRRVAISTAATAFQSAIMETHDARVAQQHVYMKRNRIELFERAGFDALFPVRVGDCDHELPTQRRRKQRHTDAHRMPDAQQLQQQLKTEQLFAVLLEKRKQLVRDELARVLLPRRSEPSSNAAAAAAVT